MRILRETVDLEPTSSTWKLLRKDLSGIPGNVITKAMYGKDYSPGKGNVPRRVDVRSLVMRGHRGAVVARQRAIHLANGELNLGEGPPWEGTPRVHPHDDRRTPILWVEGGIGQRVVDPQDKEWWKNPHYFKQELLESELTSAIWCAYTHYG